ncbi:MAG: hypothetical protein ABIR96_09905 [Bdellovibrionota bacterium]
MKNLALSLVALTASLVAHADGFKCETVEGDLAVKVYNHVSPENGTRSAAVMIISDTSVSAGRKTIARFTDANERLSNAAASYVGDVDLRFNDSGRKGELISGTKLGELDQILVDIDFSYGAPVTALSEVSGTMTLLKRSGEEIVRDLACVRYLKN